MKRSRGLRKPGVVNSDGHAIGLDIGATAVRAAVLSPFTAEGRPAVSVHGIGQVDLAPGTVVRGMVQDPVALTAALKQLWAAQKFTCKQVVLGVANQQVLVRDLEVPNLPPAELARALPFQAREVVALPMDEVVLDFAPLQPPDPASGTVRGLLLATPRAPVLAAVHAVERAGLGVARVDLASFAALRAAAGSGAAVEAVVDLGAHLTTVVVHAHGVPRVVRTLTRGGQEVTARIVDQLGLSPEDAEAAKREVGLTPGTDGVGRAVEEALRPLVAELRASLRYFATLGETGSLESISLTGHAAHLPGLPDLMSRQLGAPTLLVDALRNTTPRSGSGPSQYEIAPFAASAVSVGLAMGAAA